MAAVRSRRWWALGALAVSVLVVGLDLFVLNLALPTLSVSLHASSLDLQWFVDSYSLALAATLLPAGLLGDRWGRKRMLAGALGIFGLSSLACAYSVSTGELIAARTALGLAAAVILPMSLAVLPVLFTPEERPKAIAVVGGATFVGYPVGPILGGWLLDHFWWGSVFLINVPVALIAIIAVLLLMPESYGERSRQIDMAGVLISSAGLMLVTYGLIKAGQNGWSDVTAILTMTVGAITLAAFGGWELLITRRVGAGRVSLPPLVDLSLFRSRGFTWGTILSTLVSFALFGIIFAMPQYFLDVRGMDSLSAGLRMLPMICGLAAGLGVGQRLQTPRAVVRKQKRHSSEHTALPGDRPGDGTVSDRRAERPAPRTGKPPVPANVLTGAGFAIMAAALALGASTSTSSGDLFTATWFMVTGLGLGLSMPTAINAAIGALSAARSGSGSAVITAMRQVGGTIGVAVLGTVLATAYRQGLSLTGLASPVASAIRSSVATGAAVARRAGSRSLLDAVRTSYVHGLDEMLWVCGGIAIGAALLALALLPRSADEPERRMASDGTTDDLAASVQ